MLRRLILALTVLLGLSVPIKAQFTTVTGTVTDSANIAFIQGTYNITLTNPTTFPPLLGGVAMPSSQFIVSGQLDATGSFSVQLSPNTGTGSITVGGAQSTQWTFRFCANPSQTRTYPSPASNTCFNSVQTIVSGSPQVLGLISGPTAISTGGNGGGACIGPNCFLLSTYGSRFDTRENNDGSWAGGVSTLITFPNNDGNVSAADVGKLCWAMPGASMNTGPSAPGTVISVPSPQSLNCTASAIVGTAASNGVSTWGHDDTPAMVAASAALYNQPKCGTLILPAGRGMLSQGLSPNFSVASDCGISIIGQGYTSTTIELLPGFSFTAVTSGMTCAATGCFWNSSAASSYFNFTFNGELQSLSGISANNITSLFTIPAGGLAINVDFFNWATSVSNLGSGGGVNMTGFAAYGIGLFAQNWGTGNMNFITYTICNNCGTVGESAHINGGTLVDTAGTYNGGVLVDNGGTLIANTTRTPAQTGASNAWGCSNGTLDLYHALIGQGSPAAGAIGLQIFNYSGANCTVHARSTLFNGGGSGAGIVINASSTLDLYLDDNGNSFSTPNFLINGTLRVHQRLSGVCTFAAATTCAVTFTPQFGNSTVPTFLIPPNITGTGTTLTVSALSTTAATITASASNSAAVGWEAVLN